ncbi:hypothetical protein MBLNU230_g2402t1 [Neophaeotheca triangularis]
MLFLFPDVGLSATLSPFSNLTERGLAVCEGGAGGRIDVGLASLELCVTEAGGGISLLSSNAAKASSRAALTVSSPPDPCSNTFSLKSSREHCGSKLRLFNPTASLL